jgi:predicted ATPase
MIYLTGIARRESQIEAASFPFSLPIVQRLEKLEFKSSVTFLTGENGSGKSTILEALAAGVEAFALGASGRVVDDPYLTSASQLAKHYYFSRRKYPPVKMFFRSEDALGYVRALNEERLDDYIYNFKKNTGRDANDIDARRHQFIRNNEIDTRSHGEGFLDLMLKRLHGGGLYFLDEPETPLSISNQIQFVQILRDAVTDGAQFVIVTHSPILLALPDASIYEIESDGALTEKNYDELTSVRLLKRFLATPERYLNEE